MRLKIFFAVFFIGISQVMAQKSPTDEIKTSKGLLKIHPVMHASVVLTWDNKTIYVDPTGSPEMYKSFAAPDIILITDVHGDHMDLKALEALNTKQAIIVAPQAVALQLPLSLREKLVILNNGMQTSQLAMMIKAIPMYNLPQDAEARHTKGRGNGYLLTIGGKSIYISGDTEDIPEMRALEDVDIAFVCMNLPYTMDINQAASAVLEFKPGIVYPYHHRGQDINAFKKLVNEKNRKIDVRIKNWYPGSN
ncbi:MBL fold metallo-hydrolase [Daejeonella lutea]|uniref:L-ascorbate metabolism protein UlaG, beta-lactamase superfamily n=1 Tax=Daejeonella lutea TaxID=572036 RepID=A0A1T5ASX4_9SPHI|nr:MBL fold metallo-hydrolase [Daejeonella lutea]SKB37995.1 L-ascorbate metabolism protein UlaG, beta-lactamase superfamily [Daejeonella lutea]